MANEYQPVENLPQLDQKAYAGESQAVPLKNEIIYLTEDIITTRSTTLLTQALVKAKSEMEVLVAKDKDGNFRNKFASLEALIGASIEALNNNGLSLRHYPTNRKLVTKLEHISGEFEMFTYHFPPHKDDVFGLASMITYGRRYTLQSILGLVGDEDDDGGAAHKPASSHYGRRDNGGGHRVQPDNGPSRGSGGGTAANALTGDSVLAAAHNITNEKELNQVRGMMNRAAKLQVLHGEQLKEVAAIMDQKEAELKNPARLEEATY